jgi:hypothetical protein
MLRWQMMRLPALLLLAASGCAQLFGIDETSSPTIDPSRVSLTMQRWSIGASVSKNPLDLSKQTADFLLDDGAGNYTKLPGENTAADVLSAALPAPATPPVLFSLPDLGTPYKRLWANPARDRRGVFAVHEHPSPQAPSMSSQIMLAASLPSPYVSGESFRVEAIGAWMVRGLVSGDGLPTPGLGATSFNVMLAYSSFSRMTGSPPARITSQDVVVVERYMGNQLTGVYQVPPFDQTDGTDPINANLVAVPANNSVSATVTPSAYIQRFNAVRPAVSTLGMSWVMTAAAGWSIGSNAGPLLNAGNVMMTDTMISTTWGNPYESLDWRSLLQFNTSTSRTYMFMGIALGLSAQMYVNAEPAMGMTLDMPAGLPINIRVNQVPLSTDGMSVMLDLTKAVEVDAITDRPNATTYFVSLYEVALSSDGMAVERKLLVDAAFTGEPKIKLPPELFQLGHYYYFDFRSMQGGFTNGATGDFQTLALPFSVSRADSAVFQVVAP